MHIPRINLILLSISHDHNNASLHLCDTFHLKIYVGETIADSFFSQLFKLVEAILFPHKKPYQKHDTNVILQCTLSH